MACPLCCGEFQIPLGGCEKFPNYFSIKKLILELPKFSDFQTNDLENKIVFCEICVEVVSKTGYCKDCEQHLCESCSLRHPKQKNSQNHTIIILKKKNGSQVVTNRTTYCGEHEEKQQIELYCYKCNLTVCELCFAIHHNGHKCSDLKESSELFKKQLKEKHPKISNCESKCLDEVKQLEMDKSNFLERVQTIEEDMRQRGDEVKKLDDQLQRLSEQKEAQLKLMTIRKNDVERQLIIMKSFRIYTEELIDKRSPCDVSRLGNELLTRADELILLQAAFEKGKFCPIKLKDMQSDISSITSGHEKLMGSMVSVEM